MPAAKELRGFLKEKLPGYMIPSAFEVLDALPLMPNGKIDRQALPAPDLSGIIDEAVYTPPRTYIEEMLTGIWAEVLGVDRVGIHDNFFEAGGHSLLATQVVSRIRKMFNVEIPLRTLFERPTVSELAEALGTAHNTGKLQTAPPVLPVSRQEPLPLSFAQERMWFLNRFNPGSSAYNMPFAVRLCGHLDVAALERVMKEIIRRHEILRTTFPVENDMPVQRIAPEAVFRLPLDDISAMPEESLEAEALRLAREEASRPFDLSEGPLLRARLLRIKPDEHMLVLTMHHIIFDGWSTGILFQELSALYEAFLNGGPSPLPELHLQYADFAVWQRQWLRGETLDSQLSYWRQQLKGPLPVIELPADYPRPEVQTHRGTYCSLELSRETGKALNALSRRAGVTLFMTILAAFDIMLQKLTGQDDIVVGAPIAGRNSSEIETLIGLFVNTLVLRTDLSGNPPFMELIGRVRGMVLSAYDHQGVPFEKLVEDLQPERHLGHTPLIQVMLNMTNTPLDTIELSGLRAEVISPAELESKFDLTLYVTETDEGILLDLVYNPDLFGRPRMTGMLEQMRFLLEQIVEDPEKTICSYSLRSPYSAHLLPNPETVLESGTYPSVVRSFLIHAGQSPGQTAIVQGGMIWTYGELAEGVRTLAARLIDMGIGRGDVVAVTGKRSFGLITCIVSTLLSGGVLLAIDPELPPRRKDANVPGGKGKATAAY